MRLRPRLANDTNVNFRNKRRSVGTKTKELNVLDSNAASVVKDAVKWLAKHSELEDCSTTLGVVMLRRAWSDELVQCILNPKHVRESLSKENAEDLLSTGILRHCHLEALLDPVLDQMGEHRAGEDRECATVLLYEMLRHFEVVIPLDNNSNGNTNNANNTNNTNTTTNTSTHNSDAGGALDMQAKSLVPSLLRYSQNHPLQWEWPVPESTSEYSRTIHFKFYRPPNILPRMIARATREWLDLVHHLAVHRNVLG